MRISQITHACGMTLGKGTRDAENGNTALGREAGGEGARQRGRAISMARL